MVTQPTRRLLRTGQSLTVLGLGCAPLGGLYDAVSAGEARSTIDAAWAGGCRLFDTAPFYGYGLAEHRLGEALRERPRDEWVLSTKVGRLLRPTLRRRSLGVERAPGDAWAAPLPFEPVFDYSGAGVRRSLEDSLQRLGANRLDIVLVHDIGELTHGSDHRRHWQAFIEGGGLRELEAMKREGHVGAIGLGVNESQIVLDVLEHADLDCCLIAGRYTLLEQTALSLLERCLERKVGVIIGGPFNSGLLAARDRVAARYNYEPAPPAVRQKADALARVCAAHGVSLAAAAVQFPLAHPAVVACVPGARSASEVGEIRRWSQQPLPASLWVDLRRESLLDGQAPVPRSDDAR